MQAYGAVARGTGRPFSLEPLQVQPLQAGEILVRIAGVGLCHTDLIFRDQFIPYPVPAVLGHEGAGVIEAIGPDVSGLEVGDEVVLAYSSCGACPRCEEGAPGYCRDFVPLNYAGARTADGSTAYRAGDEAVASHFFGQSSFATHAVTRARNAVKVTGAAAPLAMLGPLGCGFQTGAGSVMRALACPAGSSITIFGGGPVGLAAVMGAVIQDCATIIMVEPLDQRGRLALELGATAVIDPADGDLAASLRALLPLGTDFALDTSGHPGALEAALGMLAPRGTLGLVGVPGTADAVLSVNIAAAITFGQRIMGIMEGDTDPVRFIPELIAHHAAGRFPFDRLIRSYGLDAINEAIADQARGDCVKAVLIP